MDGRGPVERQPVEGGPLGVADGDEGHVLEVREERPQVRQVEPPVEGVHGGRRDEAREREREVVHVTVDHVELAGALEHLGQLEHVGGERIGTLRIEPQRGAGDAVQPAPRHRVAAGEHGDGVAAVDELVRQVGHDPFGPPVAHGRDPLVQRSDLSDPHDKTPARRCAPTIRFSSTGFRGVKSPAEVSAI